MNILFVTKINFWPNVELDEAPMGMYAITTIPIELNGILKPGVIFTLKQIKRQVYSIAFGMLIICLDDEITTEKASKSK